MRTYHVWHRDLRVSILVTYLTLSSDLSSNTTGSAAFPLGQHLYWTRISSFSSLPFVWQVSVQVLDRSNTLFTVHQIFTLRNLPRELREFDCPVGVFNGGCCRSTESQRPFEGRFGLCEWELCPQLQHQLWSFVKHLKAQSWRAVVLDFCRWYIVSVSRSTTDSAHWSSFQQKNKEKLQFSPNSLFTTFPLWWSFGITQVLHIFSLSFSLSWLKIFLNFKRKC